MATTSDKSPVFLDTNILLRSNVVTAPLHREVRAMVESLWNGETEMWISRQVLREYLSSVTRPQVFMKPMSSDVATARIRLFEAQFHVADETTEVTKNLLTLLETISIGGKQIHDANIVATMQTYGIKRLCTLNIVDFTRFSDHITLLSVNAKE